MDGFRNLFSPSRSTKSSRKHSREGSLHRREGEDDDISSYEDYHNKIESEKEKPEMQHQEDQLQIQVACKACNIEHELGTCNMPVLIPSAPIYEQTEEQKQRQSYEKKKKAVSEIAEVNQLLNSKKSKKDGDQIMKLLEGACEKLVEDQLQAIMKKMEIVHSKVNSIQIQKEDEIEEVNADRKRLDMLERTLNPCTPYVHNIAYVETPKKLKKSHDQKTSLDRSYKIASLFKNIQSFKDDTAFPIRLFLNAMTSTANNSPENINITESEFYSALWNKLDPHIQTMFKTEQVDTIDKLYQALITNFDVSETPMEAFAKIQSMKPTMEMRTIKDFLTEIRRLNDLSQGTESEKSRNFMIAMKAFLPHRLKQQLHDKVELDYNTLYPGQSPPMQYLVSFLKAHNAEIQEHLDQAIRKKMQIRQVNVETNAEDKTGTNNESQNKPKPPAASNGKRPTGNLVCQKCGKKSHTAENCWSGRICQKCGRANHIGSVCRAICKLCGQLGHGTVSCPIYVNEVPMGSRCPICYEVLSRELFHSEASCRIKDCKKN